MIRIQSRPDLEDVEALNAVREHYGLDGRLMPLPGERDRNFLLEANDGARYVVKVSSPEEPPEILAFETEMIVHVHAESDRLVPAVVPSTEGALLVEHTDPRGVVHRLRVVEFIEGVLLADVKPRSLELLEALGRSLARLDSALGSVPTHPPARTGFDWALGNAGGVMERGLGLLEGDRRELVQAALAVFRAKEPDFLGLGSQVIHGDVNDHNVLVSRNGDGPTRVKGIIDLGDAHSAPRVFDLAIAIAYAAMGTPDPLAAAAAVTRGFHSQHPLLAEELDVVIPLVRARLGQSVCISTWRRHQGETDAYLLVSERPAWDLLGQLHGVPNALATGILRHACGMAPCPRSAPLQEWLSKGTYASVMRLPAGRGAVGILDLSVGSPILSGRDTDDTAAFTAKVREEMARQRVAVGIGRYLEPRAFYLTPAFDGREGDPRERRTVHLGIDLFDNAGAEVHAPLPGRVKSVTDNDGRLDYGPTVILEHDGPVGPFWTLYGHLERASVRKLVVGQEIATGEAFARIGPHPENGDWPPHLHFQIVTDLLGYRGEFPGVALPREMEVWACFSPDPNVILGLPGQTTFTAPKDLERRRRSALGPSLSLSYEKPIHVVRGMAQYLYDVMGREYLDCVNNVAHVGHEHPTVVEATRRQVGVLNTNTRYLHESVIEYAERLAALLPQPLSVCFFVNSGSEANELALRLARAHTGRKGVVGVAGGYHGNTTTLVDASHYKHAGAGGSGAPAWFRSVPLPDEFRGMYRRDVENRGARYAAHVEGAFAALDETGLGGAAFIAESILSCGGQIDPPEGWLAGAYRHARDAGAVTIADEVQIGFGRVGSHLWGFEAHGVVPDIVTMGKPIGNGHPIGAVVTTPEIAASFANGMEYFSTFGGNPVSACIGLAVLEVLRREGLQTRAEIVGERILAGLTSLMETHGVVGDVRGRGLFIGVEFVKDRGTLEPAAEIASYVVEHLKERGVLLSTDGPDHNVIKIKPPLTFDEEDADRLVAEMDAALGHDRIAVLSG